MGRPKKENPKTKGFRIRLNEYEHMVIKEMANTLGISVTSLFIEGLQMVWKEKVSKLSDEQLTAFCERTIALSNQIHERSKTNEGPLGG